MEDTCARAVELGLPSVAFTEHVDHTRWVVTPSLASKMGRHADRVRDGHFRAPPLDVEGYQECLARCRQRFPGLRIVSGAELGEPHWFEAETRALLKTGAYERLLGSVHTVVVDGQRWIVDMLLEGVGPGESTLSPAAVVRAYLREAVVMVSSCDTFGVLAHIDYPARGWPRTAGPFRPTDFEAEYREVLAALAASGRCLEVNTRVPLAVEVVRWWHEAGGDAVSFGSDAHTPRALARDFEVAAAMVEANGFRPGRDDHDFWRRA
jgi:histidinol-phosphatase (PHP family)